MIPGGNDTRLNLTINSKNAKRTEIAIEITGELPKGSICVMVPESEGKKLRKMNGVKAGWVNIDKMENRKNYRAVSIPFQKSLKLVFE